MKKIVLFFFFAALTNFAFAQKYFTKNGKINFVSMAKLEKIEADNNKATSVYDAATGALEFAVLIKGFAFEKALMQEHFNENYLESSKFPKASFIGKVTNPTALNLSKDGTYTTDVAGKLTIHGQTKEVKTKATFTVKGGKVSASSSFKVLLADYKIEIPTVVKDQIAKEVTISISSNYELMK